MSFFNNIVVHQVYDSLFFMFAVLAVL